MINYFRCLFTAYFIPHKFLSAVRPVIGVCSGKNEDGQACYKYVKSIDYHWKDEEWKCVDCCPKKGHTA